MDIEAIKAFTKTGSVVGLVCLITYLIVTNLFKEPVYQFLGSEKIFILLLVILGLLTTIIVCSKKKPSPEKASTQGPTVNYRDSSKHNGDNRF